MANSDGARIAGSIRQKMEELKKICAGLDEVTASRAPAGRWSPKEVLSHLCGPEGQGHLPIFHAFLKEAPAVEIDPGNPFFTERRSHMTVFQLLSEAESNYESVARFAERLSPEQLERRAYVPRLKGSPMGDHPALKDMIRGIGESHLAFHIDHLREILAQLAA